MMLTQGTTWQVAAARACASAFLVGALGFLGVYSQTDDFKTLLVAGLTPALGVLVTRLGAEGYLDSRPAKDIAP